MLSFCSHTQQIVDFKFFFFLNNNNSHESLNYLLFVQFLFNKCSSLIFGIIQNDMDGKLAKLFFFFFLKIIMEEKTLER